MSSSTAASSSPRSTGSSPIPRRRICTCTSPRRAATRPRWSAREAWLAVALGADGGGLPGRGTGDLAEDRARHEPGAAGVIEIEQAADQLARGVEAADRLALGVDHARVGVDLEAAEGEGNAAGD